MEYSYSTTVAPASKISKDPNFAPRAKQLKTAKQSQNEKAKQVKFLLETEGLSKDEFWS
jgi:hypothetical protein